MPFVIFVIAATAELNRPPFDLVEAEQELVGGFNTEYSAFGFALFFLAEFMNTITMSAIIVTLFLGGPQPLFDDRRHRHPADRRASRARSGSSLKMFVFLYVYVWFRATLPRLRYDQLMDLGWKLLIPVVARLVPAARRAPARPTTTTGTRGSSSSSAVACLARSARAAARGAPCASSGRNREREGAMYLMGYLEGFLVTLRQHRLFGGKRVTTEYSGGRAARKQRRAKHGTPAEALPRRRTRRRKSPKPERLHGRHVLNRYEDGMEKCIGCELCAGVCPAKCIYVRGADNDPDNPTSPGERFGFVYEINYLRCIHCDLCVEACPTEAITESKLFEFSFTNRQDAIYTKAELLVDDDGKPQQLPWEDWREGEDAHHERLDAGHLAGGDADFVGEVGWSGELGYGVRATGGAERVTHRDRQRARTAAAWRHARPSDAMMDLRRLRARVGDGARRRARRRACTATRCTPRSASCSRCSASPCTSSRMEAHFLAAVQVIVYAGAIVVLFLFVIMLLGVDQADDLRDRAVPDPAPARRRHRRRHRRPADRGDRLDPRRAAARRRHRPRRRRAGDADGEVADHDANIHQLAANLFSDHVFAFEFTSVLLIVAVAGTVVLTARGRPKRRGVDDDERRDRRDRRRRRRGTCPRGACCSASAPSACSSAATRS